MELDDTGFPPEEIRQQLLAEHGVWELRVDAPVDAKQMVARTLKDALHLSMGDAARLLSGLPGRVYSGTDVEVNWLKSKLERSGIVSESARIDVH